MVNLSGPADWPLKDFPENRREPADSMAHDPDLDALPVPASAVEVIEVDDDAAWALWEDSVAFQDSQFPDEAAFVRTLQTPLDRPDETVEFIDPFASVHKKSR